MRISLPRTTRGLAVLMACIAGVTAAIVGFATYNLVHEEIERQLDRRIQLETSALVELYDSGGFAALGRVIDHRSLRETPGDPGYLPSVDLPGFAMGYILLDAAGNRRAGILKASTPPEGFTEFVSVQRQNGTHGYAQALNTRLSNGGHLVVAADRASLNQTDEGLVRIFLVELALILLILALAFAGFADIVRQRLSAIKSSAEAIMAGDMGRRMGIDGSNGEFDQLAIVLNRMLDRIGRLLDSLRQLSGDLAHDLRSPLNRLHGRLEQLEGSVSTAAERASVGLAIVEADKLLDLFAGLLAIAEVEGTAVQERFSDIDMADTIAEIVEAYGASLEAAGLLIAADLEPGRVFGDRSLLQQAVANLLDNVLTHTPEGTRVHVAGRCTPTLYVIRISDDGPGVPLRERERIFQRMVRLDAARSTPGHGLGLSMVAAIASAHAGSAKLIEEGPGTTIELVVPRGGAA